MPKLSEVVSGEATIPVFFQSGAELTVTYDPNEYTPEAEARWLSSDRAGEAGELATDFVCSLLKQWDLQDDDTGKTIPITKERVGKISMLVLDVIIGAIFEDVSKAGKGQNREARRAKKRS